MTDGSDSPLACLISGMLVLGLLLFIVSLQQLRRGRNAPYWRLRREAGQRGGQLFLLSVTLFGLAFALLFFSGMLSLALNGFDSLFSGGAQATATMTMTPTASLTSTLTPTLTATSTATPTASSTASPSATPPSATATETLTPTATFESVLQLTPMVSTRQARAGATLSIVAADSGVTANGTPLEPRSSFEAGIRRIYFFFSFRQMDAGVAWTRVLYREGVPIQGGSYLWSLDEEGASYFFFGHEAGYPAGNYEVRLFIGAEEVNRFSFTVTGGETQTDS